MERQAVEAQRIRSELTTTEFGTSGGRAVMLLLLAGRGTFISDEVEREVAGPCLIWAPTGWWTRISLAAGARGFLARLPERALGRAMPTDALSAHVRQAVSRRIFLSDISPKMIASVTTLFEKIDTELREAPPGSETVLHHCISLMLIDIWRAAAPPRQSVEQAPHRISDSFLSLVELHMQNHWTIAEYASRIGISRDSLNTAVRGAIGVPPHAHIQRRLMEEAKALLVTTNLRVAEVGYRLGFGDAAYFTRFFKRHEQLAPAQFRRKYTPLYRQRTEEVSFAQWP
ncbi:AraC family transcriptional regulator [Vannielia litorea]|uniref:helix-turn-helix domain-containing protein n=1 Tax=Vannielia TaxID=2813041 RepID=UPI001C980368|nr:helix-turn-helix domain-containing protein [Vannielia litorea]MBY6049009.1 AraC family transcriptional regulator [Vannielia litorea]MBY6076423.1 AraC family transcriptional regulator [Vannielia litorea]MBY6154642.1 AraC family transcriptional regulator [Vannielia litorea]